MKPTLSISIVSHGQGHLVSNLLADIVKYCDMSSSEVILTLNVPEPLSFDTSQYHFPIKILKNVLPKGFGENHNDAFDKAEGQYFCVLNPDVRFLSEPFSNLLNILENKNIGVVSGLVVNSEGVPEDSMRKFPTPLEILGKLCGRPSAIHAVSSAPMIYPDWIAGMFMLFRSDVFSELKGFDSAYFLYYEDVDMCARLKLKGYDVAVCTDVSIVHEAQRSSHRSFSYLRWHLSSMWRFFSSSIYRRLRKL